MSKILANQIANYGDNSPVEVKEGVNIPAGKPLQAAGASGSNGQILSSTGTSIEWIDNFSGSYNDLTNKPTIPNPQVQSDWNATSGIGVILNKPIVPPQPVVSVATASGGGNLTYNQGNGQFIFTPADLTNLATTTQLNTAVSNSSNWDTAYSWGDHALAGYATAAREAEWDAAYSWGDHALAGYLTSEADTLQTVMARGATTSLRIVANGGIRADIVGVGGGTGSGDVQLQHDDQTNDSALTHFNTLGDFTVSSVTNLTLVGGLSEGGEVIIKRSDGTNPGTVERLRTTANGVEITGDLSVSGTVSGVNVEDLDNVDIAGGLQDQQVLKWEAATSSWKPANDLVGGATGIQFDDISVVTNPVGSASLSYNNTNGTFTYTPPNLSSYLTTETDPVFSASVAAGIIQQNVNNWNNAYSWGDHATAGYATTTQLNTALANSSDWDTAFGWGDHSTAGYLTAESDTLATVTARGATTNTNIVFPDGIQAWFGDSGDLRIYHDVLGQNSYIQDAGTGELRIICNGPAIRFQQDNTETYAVFNDSGSVDLYYDNVKKFETTSTGVTVSGDLNFTGDLYQNGVLFSGGGSGANVTISDTAPGGAVAGDLWWESDKGRLKIYYNDTDSQQWVDASPPLAAPNSPLAIGYITLNGSSPTWSGTAGYTVAHSGGGGLDEVYTLTFPVAYSSRTDYIVHATYDGTNWITGNGAQLGVVRNAGNVAITVRRWNEDPLNQGEIMITITNL